jgi:hypothetical protein
MYYSCSIIFLGYSIYERHVPGVFHKNTTRSTMIYVPRLVGEGGHTLFLRGWRASGGVGSFDPRQLRPWTPTSVGMTDRNCGLQTKKNYGILYLVPFHASDLPQLLLQIMDRCI